MSTPKANFGDDRTQEISGCDRPCRSDARQQVRVCRHTTCTKDGAAAVHHVFVTKANEAIEVIGSGCMGQCGSGPMVLLLPEEKLYSHVQPRDVAMILAQQSRLGQLPEGSVNRFPVQPQPHHVSST
ncbi:MAG: (2Fe-2S) ferredoxin domain-containing protein [Leptolyngbyaceae cyanobacterium]